MIMTIAEARSVLLPLCSAPRQQRSLCVEIQCWDFASGSREVIYKVSVLPGTDGSKCEGWEAPTLHGAVEQARAALEAANEQCSHEERIDAADLAVSVI